MKSFQPGLSEGVILLKMTGWMNHKLEARLLGEIPMTRDVDYASLTAEREKELKRLLMRVKEESEKNCLKIQHSENEDYGIWSHHFMANRWGNSGNSVRLYFFGLQNHCR